MLTKEIIIEMVFLFAVENKRSKDTPQGKKHIETWVKAKLFDIQNQTTNNN